MRPADVTLRLPAPLAVELAARYRAAYDGARSAGYDFPTGVQFILYAFMNSPNFLYRIELDAPRRRGKGLAICGADQRVFCNVQVPNAHRRTLISP